MKYFQDKILVSGNRLLYTQYTTIQYHLEQQYPAHHCRSSWSISRSPVTYVFGVIDDSVCQRMITVCFKSSNHGKEEFLWAHFFMNKHGNICNRRCPFCQSSSLVKNYSGYLVKYECSDNHVIKQTAKIQTNIEQYC